MNDWVEFAKGAGAIPKELYDDAAKPIIQPLGKGLGILARVIPAVLQPLERWVDKKDHEAAQRKIELSLSEKLKNTPKEELVSPRPMIAQPALEGMALTLDEEDLFDLFSNLLAKSMIKQHKDTIHPGFIAVLKEMTPLEARLARWIFEYEKEYDSRSIPCIGIKAAAKNKKDAYYEPLQYYFGEVPYGIFNNNDEIYSASLNNLARLGIIFLPKLEQAHVIADRFPPLENDVPIKELIISIENHQLLSNYSILRNYTIITKFGVIFLRECLVPPK
ncbi:MAG: DUF4393 domain-containing protein [Nitrospirae bacterium]|nr:DUF4393 domain-containing protein [Magnetococcales bacterium]HAT51111.1 hypothetical protein [Alphaproteobacteria bacterium]